MQFSIIVPVYNAEEYLSECIESILAQTFRDFELILVNDGSKDRSIECCYQYLKKDSRIVVIDKENEGVCMTRQRGVEMAQGEYLCFVDADDWIDSSFLADSHEAIMNCHADIVCFGYTCHHSSGQKDFQMPAEPGLYQKDRIERQIFPGLICDAMDRSFTETVWGKAIKAELYRSNQLKNVKVIMGEDGACIKPCLFHADSIYISDKCLYHYRESVSSATGAGKVRSWNEPWMIEKHLRDHIDTDLFDFEKQIQRSTAHALFNTAVSQFSQNLPRKTVMKNIHEVLKTDQCRKVANAAEFDNLQGKLCTLVLKHRIGIAVYLRWKMLHRKADKSNKA